MTIDLSLISFERDFFTTSLPDNSTLVLNRIDESIAFAEKGEEIIKRINIQVISEDELSYKSCSSVIGLGDDLIKITTYYAEYKGKILTEENMKYCKIEVEDEF